MEKLLGKGMSGEVHLATSKASRKVVLKRISKHSTNFDRRKVIKEIKSGLVMDHENVIKCTDSFDTPEAYYIELEYFEGVDLYTLMKGRNFQLFPERTVKKMFSQLVDALLHCHERGVVHRDVKLDNVLIDRKGLVKLIDFGLCEFTTSHEQVLRGWVGSLEYAAPEILLRIPYDGFKADVWSLGVLLFALLYGEFPYLAEDFLETGVMPAITWPDAQPTFNGKVSESVKELLKKMLHVNPNKRISLEEVKRCEWMYRQAASNTQ